MYFVGLSVLIYNWIAKVCDGSGTSQHIQEVFTGRCYEYQTIIHNVPNSKFLNCTVIWNKFAKAFAYKEPCGVKPADYADFIDYVDDGIKLRNKALFWEATLPMVSLLCKAHPNFISMDLTFAGYFGNNLYWCAGSDPPGVNYTICPTREPTKSQCGHNVLDPFWTYASRHYAKKSEGIVHLLLNGSRNDGQPAYSRNSYFALNELPNLRKNSVEEVRVMVIYNLTRPPKERCGMASFKLLEEDVKKYGIKMTCTDNPPIMRPLLCTQYPSAKDCAYLKASSSDAISFQPVRKLLKQKE